MSTEPPPALDKPTALLFDWDGTLVDTHRAIHLAMNDALVAFEMEPWSFEQWSAWVGQSAEDVFPKLFGQDWERARKIYLDAYEAHHLETLVLKPGSEALVEHLKSKPLHLGIVSNKTGHVLRREVEHLAWGATFARVLGAGDCANDKPAPDPALAALEGSGQEPGRHVWFIGDNPVDVACGRAAGCATILVGTGAPDVTPDHRVADLSGLSRVISEVLEG